MKNQWFPFARHKAMVKQATKMCNLFCNIAAKWVVKLCCGFYHILTCLATNHVFASCVNTDFWLGKITQESSLTEDSHHLQQNKFALSWQNAQHVQILLPKVEFLSAFCNNVLQPATTWFVAGQVWFMGGKMCNITIQLALQQHSKTSCTSLLPVLPNLKKLFIVNVWLGQGRGGVGWILIRILCWSYILAM